MKKTVSKLRFADLPKDYAGLCRAHLPRPIHDSVGYTNTVEVTDAMAGHDLSQDQEDYFDLLCRLIEDYEQAKVSRKIRRANTIETLQHLLDEHGMTAADLARLLKVHRTLGGMILRGERKLTLGHVTILAKHFKVSADLFVSP